jgi:hypothetical protein
LPSAALSVHLRELLRDAEELDDAHAQLRTGNPGRQYGIASLNRAAVIMSVSAWESYIEELVRESVQALQPVGPNLGAWPALNVFVTAQLNRFHTPNTANVTRLIHDCLGLANVHLAWSWQNCTPVQAAQRLDSAMQARHRIAHGVNPRDAIDNRYSSELPGFFRRLARYTDAAVRNHLVTAYGVATPWLP